MESSESVQRKENRAAQAEEMEALHAIYGEDFQFYPDAMFCEVWSSRDFAVVGGTGWFKHLNGGHH